MELTTQLPKFNSIAMMSLDNRESKTNSMGQQDMATTPGSDLNLNAVNSMFKKIMAPAAYPELVASQQTAALETLGETYLAVKKDLPDIKATEPGEDTTVETTAPQESPEAKVDIKVTLANQNRLVDKTEASLDKVGTSVKNDALNAKMLANQLKAEYEVYKRADDTRDSSPIDTGTSYGDLWARIAAATLSIKTEYVDFYASLMQKYTEMYEAFNEYCQKASSSAVSSGSDGNNVNFNGVAMRDGYKAFNAKLAEIEKELGSVENWDLMEPEQREAMIATLEPAFKVGSDGKISFNTDQYNSVNSTAPSGISIIGDWVMGSSSSTASYQAWLATFNAAGSAFQSNMQSFAQRYSQANSTFDNLNKVLSGAISSMADSAKEVLRSLG